MKRAILITLHYSIEVITLCTLLVCCTYLLSKAVSYFELKELPISLLFIGVGLLVYYIQESLFKEKREKLGEVLKTLKR